MQLAHKEIYTSLVSIVQGMSEVLEDMITQCDQSCHIEICFDNMMTCFDDTEICFDGIVLCFDDIEICYDNIEMCCAGRAR